MTVYVDDMKAPFVPTHVPGRRYVMCHMIADTTEELLDMVKRIGVNPKWIQDRGTWKEHFDITMTKRRLAVMHGAKEITQMELGRILATRLQRTRRTSIVAFG